MTRAKAVAKMLDEKQLAFLQEEFRCDSDAFYLLNGDALSSLYDKICDIEVEETMKADNNETNLSKRGKTAESIVTLIGNMLYISEDDESAVVPD